ncbi:PH domain-containing protein [Nocardiopsis sediminis]|uniref:PH domain-containing protein n=1 Tax=Nocardiopsis sediminis TaxID=1778267 RepID=A0ABV8FQT0_9ACTN
MKPLTAPVSRVMAWVWAGIVVVLLGDLALNGSGRSSLVAGAVLLVSVGAAYVLWMRPRVVPTQRGLRIINPMRETFVPWSAFTWADVTDVLRVHAGDRVVRAWPLRETKRAQVRENLRRAGDGVALDDDADPRELRPMDLAARELRREAERRKADPAPSGPEPAGAPGVTEPTTVWSPDSVAALLIPLFLLAMALLVG